jgi:methionyl-tRNA formyltransferase
LDLLITAHAYVKVPADVISRARFAVGYHPSLLPLYRGMGAVQKTLANGDPVAGGSVYHLTEGFDEGPIAAQDWCFVRPEDGPIELWRRELAPIGVRLLSETAIELARSGTIVGRPQDEGMTRALRETEAGLKAV